MLRLKEPGRRALLRRLVTLAKAFGIPADFVIFDEDDAEELLRAVLRQRLLFAHLSARSL